MVTKTPKAVQSDPSRVYRTFVFNEGENLSFHVNPNGNRLEITVSYDRVDNEFNGELINPNFVEYLQARGVSVQLIDKMVDAAADAVEEQLAEQAFMDVLFDHQTNAKK